MASSQNQVLTETYPDKIFGDRRGRGRYSISLPIQFSRVDGRLAGTGIVVNISSSGIAFRTDDPIECGTSIDASILWKCPNSDSTITLIVYGRVVRNDKVAAIHMLRHEFRGQTALAPSFSFRAREGVTRQFMQRVRRPAILETTPPRARILA